MTDEVKKELQDESQKAADSVVEDTPSAGAEETPQSTEGNEAKAGTAPAEVKSIEPQDQTFWEDSVDANSLNLSEGETPQEEETKAEESPAGDTEPVEDTPVAEEESQPEANEPETTTAKTDEAEDAATTPPPREEEGKCEEEDQLTEQEPAAEQDSEQEETPKAEELPAGDTEPVEDTPVAEEESQPEANEPETTTAKTDEAENAATTPSPQEEGKDEEENQPAEQEPVAVQDAEQEEAPKAEESPSAETEPAAETPEAQEVGQEETATDTEAADTKSEEPQEKGKVISIYEYLRKKRLLTGIGILLLVAGSIGYTVAPGLLSPGTITSTLLGGIPESAYSMKFFLPLNVGYEKAQFVKVTIALELMDEGLQKELDKNLAHLRKEVIDLILTKSPKEVRSAGGKKKLSREITRRINNYLSKDCIKETYFTELVIL